MRPAHFLIEVSDKSGILFDFAVFDTVLRAIGFVFFCNLQNMIPLFRAVLHPLPALSGKSQDCLAPYIRNQAIEVFAQVTCELVTNPPQESAPRIDLYRRYLYDGKSNKQYPPTNKRYIFEVSELREKVDYIHAGVTSCLSSH
jgi:hypothetical protein